VLFYLVTYGMTTLGAFAVLALVRDSAGEQTTIARWAGLGKDSPVVAGVFALFLLSMAGIPLTAGFTGKWSVFEVALAAGAWPVVIVAVLASAAAAFFYVRVIVVMYFHEPNEQSAYVVNPSILAATAIGVSAAATVALGLVPGPILDLANTAGQFIR
jgi:NADH-quinone oxidoreductase subunit N